MDLLLPFFPSLRKRRGILTLDEAAELLGIEKRLMVKALSADGLPHLRILGRYYFERDHLMSWKQMIIAAYGPGESVGPPMAGN